MLTTSKIVPAKQMNAHKNNDCMFVKLEGGASAGFTVDRRHGGAEGHARANIADGARDARNVGEQRNACNSGLHEKRMPVEIINSA